MTTGVSHWSMCPYCFRKNELVTQADGQGAMPEDGDVSICFGCGCIGMFDSTRAGRIRKCTTEEMFAITSDPEIQAILSNWGEINQAGVHNDEAKQQDDGGETEGGGK